MPCPQVNPMYGFDIDTSRFAWKVFSLVRLELFMESRGLSFALVRRLLTQTRVQDTMLRSIVTACTQHCGALHRT